MIANVLQWAGGALIVAGFAAVLGLGAALLAAGVVAVVFGIAEERK